MSGDSAPAGENRDHYYQWSWISLSDPHSQAECPWPVSTLILLCKTLGKQSKPNLYNHFLFPLQKRITLQKGKAVVALEKVWNVNLTILLFRRSVWQKKSWRSWNKFH